MIKKNYGKGSELKPKPKTIAHDALQQFGENACYLFYF